MAAVLCKMAEEIKEFKIDLSTVIDPREGGKAPVATEMATLEPASHEPTDPIVPAQPVNEPAKPVAEKLEPVIPVTPASSPVAAAVPPVEKPEFNLDNLLKEKTGGKIKSLTELEALVAKPVEEFASDQIKALNAWVKRGGTENDFFRAQSLDTSKMSDTDKVKARMAIEKPHLSAEKIDLLFDDAYTLDAEVYDEKQVRTAQVKLEEAAREAEAKLTEFKSANAVPAAERQRQEALAQQQAENAAWQQGVESFNTGFTQIEVPLEGGEKFTFPVENTAQVSAIMKDPSQLLSVFLDKKGQFDMNAFREVVTFATNKEKYNAKYAEVLRGKGIEQVVAEIKNPAKAAEGTPPPARTKEQITADNMAAAFRKKGF